MLTLKLPIKAESRNQPKLDEYVHGYVGLFMRVYKDFEQTKDPNYKKELLLKFPLFDVSMIDFCISDAEAHHSSRIEHMKKKEADIARIEAILKENNFKTAKDLKHKYDLIQRLARTKRNLQKDICFGGKELLRKITKAAQDAVKQMEEVEKQKKITLYEKYKKEYQEGRQIGIYLVGRANESGNRKVDFDLPHGKITFKPNKATHIEIEFHSSAKKQFETLKKLQQMADAKLMPLTVRLSSTHVYLSYDEQLLHGFSFDNNAFKKAVGGIKDSQIKKELWKCFKDEQTDRMLRGKNANRYMAVDLNPKEISVVVGDKIGYSGEFRVIHKTFFALKYLSKKLGVASDDKSQQHQNNKREHEIKQIWTRIFNLATQFDVSHFVMEDLSLNKVSKTNNGEGFNRTTKNIWHRELTTKLITKHTNELGIIVVEVNPAYSSFIGNMCYDADYDCIAAALEILRRGIIKYKKGNSIFPIASRINRQKMIYLFGENVDGIVGLSWPKLYGKIALSGLRYRNKDVSFYSVQNMKSNKSRVQVYSPAAA